MQAPRGPRPPAARSFQAHLYAVDLAVELSPDIPPNRNLAALHEKGRGVEDSFYPREESGAPQADRDENSVVWRDDDAAICYAEPETKQPFRTLDQNT